MNQGIFARTNFTFVMTALRSLMLVAAGIYLARAMGPNTFGELSFLLASFIGLKALLDLGTSSAFYTFVSGKNVKENVIQFYFLWLILQFMVPIIIIFWLFPIDWISAIWPNSETLLIFLAWIAVFSQHGFWASVAQVGDANRATYLVQSLSFLLSLIYLTAILLVDHRYDLTISVVLFCVACEHILLGAFLYHRLEPHIGQSSTFNLVDLSLTFKKFYRFCLPLIPYTILGGFVQFADRWILQHYGGSEEQAYYAISWQIAAIALLAVTSFIRIFWKEIAEAHSQKNISKMEVLFGNSMKLAYLITAVVSCGVFFLVDDIIGLLLGDKYVSGALVLSILIFYPIHQSQGQLLGSFLYATEQTALLSISGSITLAIGVILAYLLMAPSDAFIHGFDLGAEGLAVKMLLIQFLNVSIVSYLAVRKMNWPFQLAYQFSSLIIFLGAGALSHYLLGLIMSGFALPYVLGLLFYVLAYMFIICLLIRYLPKMIGFSPSEVNWVLSKVKLVINQS